MQTYISLLRGINMSGQKKIKLQELQSMYEKCNLTDISTYIQSGNVVFRGANNQAGRYVGAIEKVIRR